MDNHMDNTNSTNGEGAALPSRPLGYWLRTVDRLLAREFAEAFAAEDITRRDWRVLSVIAGDVEAPELLERLRGKRLRSLDERGWVTRTDDGWALTDEGRAAKERLGAIVAGVRAKVAGAVSDADYTTTVASLEAIARGLGWDGSERMPRARGRGRGFRRGRGFGRGFGRDADSDDDFGARRGFGPHPGHRHPGHGGHHGRTGCGHDRGDVRGRGPGHRRTEDAYERGFAAGFARGESRRDA